jgi:hypothetical protein
LAQRQSPSSRGCELQSLVQLATIVGLTSIIRRRDPRLWARVGRWTDDLFIEFRQRRDGQGPAYTWVIGELLEPRLPDLRKGKSEKKDRSLLVWYRTQRATLRALSPKDRAAQLDAFLRRRKASPIRIKRARARQKDRIRLILGRLHDNLRFLERSPHVKKRADRAVLRRLLAEMGRLLHTLRAGDFGDQVLAVVIPVNDLVSRLLPRRR